MLNLTRVVMDLLNLKFDFHVGRLEYAGKAVSRLEF